MIRKILLRGIFLLFFTALFMTGFVLANDTAPDLVILYTGDGRGNIKCTG